MRAVAEGEHTDGDGMRVVRCTRRGEGRGGEGSTVLGGVHHYTPLSLESLEVLTQLPGEGAVLECGLSRCREVVVEGRSREG